MSVQLHISTYFLLGDGQFDSRNRYIRKVANIADKTLNMCRGPSIGVNIQNVGSSNEGSCAWAWQCGPAYVAFPVTNAPQVNPTGFNSGINAKV